MMVYVPDWMYSEVGEIGATDGETESREEGEEVGMAQHGPSSGSGSAAAAPAHTEHAQ